MWIGRFLGEEALTATVNANNVMFALMGLVFGISMASTILVGQAMGKSDIPRAKRVLGSSATFFVAASLSIAIIGYVLTPSILQWIGTPAAAQAQAQAYLHVIFLALPTMFMFSFVSAVLRGAGDTTTPFWFLLIVVVLDSVLNPVFIFGWMGTPVLGIRGAAWATLVANVLSFVALLLWLRRRNHPLWIHTQEWALFKPDWHIVRALVIKGLPMGAQMVMLSIAMIMMMSMVNSHGIQTASAYSAGMQLWTYIQMPAMAIGAACSSMAAQNVGAKQWERVAGTANAGMVCNLLLTGGLIVLVLLLDTHVLGWFLPSDSAALPMASHLNQIVVWSFLFFGVTFVISGVVRATGAVMAPLVILVIATWLVRIPVAQWLQTRIGVDSIWWSFPISAVCAMVLSLAYYRFGNWRTAQMGDTTATTNDQPSTLQPATAALAALPPINDNTKDLCDTLAIPAMVCSATPTSPVASLAPTLRERHAPA